MTTDELNAIVQAVMLELEKAGVDFDFKAETPQADDLVYVMRGTADNYKGIVVKWQNLLDIIVQKATDAKDEAVSAKDIALQTLATIQGIESNVSTMKSSVETTKGEVETLKSDVATMKASVETSEANVTQMKSDVTQMKTSVEGTKTEVEGLKSDVTALKAQTQTIVDNAKSDVVNVYKTDLSALQTLVEFYNIPRVTPKDITPYWTDGTLWSRIAGSSGFKPYDDIHVGDYIDMGRTVTCPDSYDSTVGSQYVTVASCGGFYGNGDSGITYPHIIMVPGKGFGGTQHFGRHAMHASTPHPGYVSSDMNQSVLGSVVTEGSIATGATINQQLYYIFGSHLKTIKSLLATAVSSSLYNRFGSAGGASSGWGWQSVQTRLMSEIEVYGSIVWSSSGYDTGDANHQFELFRFSKSAVNNRSAYYWLKDAASSSYFCHCSYSGYSYCYDATNGGNYVRPCFVLS